MRDTRRGLTVPAIFLAACLLLIPVSPAAAQPNPFGGAPAAPDAGAPAAPFGGVPAGPASGAPADQERDPVVLAIRENTDLQDPQALTKATRAMLDYDRRDEARRYLQALLTLKPDREQLAELQRSFGSDLFLRLLQDARVQPEAAQLAGLVLQAADQRSRDPARLAAAVNQLSDSNALNRSAAFVMLQEAREAAVAPLLKVLADPQQADRHLLVRGTLLQLKANVVEPLIASLETPDPDLKAQIMQVLAAIQADPAVAFLVGPLITGQPQEQAAARQALQTLLGGAPPNAEQVETFLLQETRRYLNGRRTSKPDHRNRVVLWIWEPSQQQAVPMEMTAANASLWVARRLAGDLYAVQPTRPDVRQLYLLALLEQVKRLGGIHQPLDPTLVADLVQKRKYRVDEIEQLLADSLVPERAGAAVGAAELLGQLGSAELLSGEQRPLTRALRHVNRNIRYAAVMSILELDPQTAFAGASFVPETLGYLASAESARRVLVGHPRADRAQTLAGILRAMGFEADIATHSRDFIRLAIRKPDYEFALLSDAIDHPDYRELVQRLRRDIHTAQLPVAIIARTDFDLPTDPLRFLIRDELKEILESRQIEFEVKTDTTDEAIRAAIRAASGEIVEAPGESSLLRRARAFAETADGCLAFPEPVDETSMSALMEQLIGDNELQWPTYEQRIAQAQVALQELTRLVAAPEKYAFYGLARQTPIAQRAIQVPPLTAVASEFLGHLGTAAAQRSLLNAASENARPLDQREAAAAGFAMAVKRQGVLLTTSEVRRQYDRYNASALLEKSTQEVLGGLLDTIESRLKRTARSVNDQ